MKNLHYFHLNELNKSFNRSFELWNTIHKRSPLLTLSLVIIVMSFSMRESFAQIDFYRDETLLKQFSNIEIAVLPFASYDPELSWKYAEEFSLIFGKLKQFKMIERLQVEKVFQEQDFDPNRIDDITAIKIGKMLGAKGIIIGSISTDYINIRLVSTQTGTHIWNARMINNDDQKYAYVRRGNVISIVATLADARLGMTCQMTSNMSPKEKRAYKVTNINAPIIVGFNPASFAVESGLKIGDVILSIDDSQVSECLDVVMSTFGKNPYDFVTIYISRKGQQYHYQLKLIKRSE